jgi:lysophospholipase L1-like esterase
MIPFLKYLLILYLICLSTSSTQPRGKIVLFGDSITEQGTAVGGTYNDLAIYYNTVADVMNRGFSGYNTDGAKVALNQMITNDDTFNLKLKTLVIIMFGSNDCVTEEFSQHVSIENYKKNLVEIIKQLISLSDNIGIVIVPPPPICDDLFRKMWNPVSRSNEGVRKYYNAALEVSYQEGVEFANTWKNEAEEWPQSDCSTHTDGLHLTEKGYKIVTKYVLKTITSLLKNSNINNSFDQSENVLANQVLHYNELEEGKMESMFLKN